MKLERVEKKDLRLPEIPQVFNVDSRNGKIYAKPGYLELFLDNLPVRSQQILKAEAVVTTADGAGFKLSANATWTLDMPYSNADDSAVVTTSAAGHARVSIISFDGAIVTYQVYSSVSETVDIQLVASGHT